MTTDPPETDTRKASWAEVLAAFESGPPAAVEAAFAVAPPSAAPRRSFDVAAFAVGLLAALVLGFLGGWAFGAMLYG